MVPVSETSSPNILQTAPSRSRGKTAIQDAGTTVDRYREELLRFHALLTEGGDPREQLHSA
jgi:hypothetical protein